MSTVREIYELIDSYAPFEGAESWDNSGLLVEVRDAAVKKMLVALDITPWVVQEAIALGANLILSHHPVMFQPVKRVSSDDVLYQLIHNDISAICAHTNLDLARGGVNDILAKRLELRDVGPLTQPDKAFLSLGRIGELATARQPEEFAQFVKDKLGCPVLRYTATERPVQRVAVCGGAGGDMLYRAAELGADALVTGDVKHHQLLDAKHLGVMLIDAGHYNTECVILQPMIEYLHGTFPKMEVLRSKSEGDPVRCL